MDCVESICGSDCSLGALLINFSVVRWALPTGNSNLAWTKIGGQCPPYVLPQGRGK